MVVSPEARLTVVGPVSQPVAGKKLPLGFRTRVTTRKVSAAVAVTAARVAPQALPAVVERAAPQGSRRSTR